MIVSIPPSPVIVSTPAEPVSVQASDPSSLDTSITLAPVASVSPDKSIVTIPSVNAVACVVIEIILSLAAAVILSTVAISLVPEVKSSEEVIVNVAPSLLLITIESVPAPPVIASAMTFDANRSAVAV